MTWKSVTTLPTLKESSDTFQMDISYYIYTHDIQLHTKHILITLNI